LDPVIDVIDFDGDLSLESEFEGIVEQIQDDLGESVVVGSEVFWKFWIENEFERNVFFSWFVVELIQHSPSWFVLGFA